MRLVNAEKLENSFELSIESWSRDCNSNAPAIANTYKMALKRVKEEPTIDAVEVVRCKKCIFYEEVEYYHPTDKNPTKNVCRLFKRQMQPNDFCSYGERRKEDG